MSILLPSEISEQDIKLAERCLKCPICRAARKSQRGLLFWFVKNVEGGFCPAGKAYEKVYGRKAHEPVP